MNVPICVCGTEHRVVFNANVCVDNSAKGISRIWWPILRFLVPLASMRMECTMKNKSWLHSKKFKVCFKYSKRI